MSELTPIFQQYMRIKADHEDKILLFRLGDFYEMFFEDARVASKALEIALTARSCGGEQKAPMCGVPYHAADGYIAKLIEKGHKVAICEQVEEPTGRGGPVSRQVVRTVTPGTTLDISSLDDRTSNYLMCVTGRGGVIGVAYADITTGEFAAAQLEGNLGESLINELERLRPRECLVPGDIESAVTEPGAFAPGVEDLKNRFPFTVFYPQDDAFFDDYYEELLKDHFKVGSLAAFGCSELPLAVNAAGKIIEYLNLNNRAALEAVGSLSVYDVSDRMIIDAVSIRNLELVRTLRDGTRTGTLLWVMDSTLTSMGGRLMHKWLLEPLVSTSAIEQRLDMVEALAGDEELRETLRDELDSIPDLERLGGRIAARVANPRELAALKDSIPRIQGLAGVLARTAAEPLQAMAGELDPLQDLHDAVAAALVDDPPLGLRDGNIIRAGFNIEVDELRSIQRGGKDWILRLEAEERDKTGIKKLRIGYNKVFGYYIEVTKSNLHQVPDHYIRKQTLVNAERYITPELKEKEAQVLGAQERLFKLEEELFAELREQAARESGRIMHTAAVLARLDVFASLAHVSVRENFSRPRINDRRAVRLKNAFHPVVRKLLGETNFVPNDTRLDCAEDQVHIITGPNMAGKSTYIRQVAVAVILAQMGSFTPAEEADIGLVDRVFTRVGAVDDMRRGQSTFMVEMSETAHILRNATRQSLILLDEVGRGTSTVDGIAIARAAAEFIHDRIGARTLFATHFHELTAMAGEFERVANYHIRARELASGQDTGVPRIVFLHKIEPGGTDKSFGIHVAQLAGIPEPVIKRAGEIMAGLEAGAPPPPEAQSAPAGQLDFLVPITHPEIDRLKRLDVESLTPLEALNLLADIKKRLQNDERGRS